MQKVFLRVLPILLVLGVAGVGGGCTTSEIGTFSSGVTPLGNNKFAIARNTLFEQTQWFGSKDGKRKSVYFWRNQPPIVVDCSKNNAEECFAFEGR